MCLLPPLLGFYPTKKNNPLYMYEFIIFHSDQLSGHHLFLSVNLKISESVSHCGRGLSTQCNSCSECMHNEGHGPYLCGSQSRRFYGYMLMSPVSGTKAQVSGASSG